MRVRGGRDGAGGRVVARVGRGGDRQRTQRGPGAHGARARQPAEQPLGAPRRGRPPPPRRPPARPRERVRRCARCGDTTLVLHRAQLVDILADALPDGTLRLGIDAAVVDPARPYIRPGRKPGSTCPALGSGAQALTNREQLAVRDAVGSWRRVDSDSRPSRPPAREPSPSWRRRRPEHAPPPGDIDACQSDGDRHAHSTSRTVRAIRH